MALDWEGPYVLISRSHVQAKQFRTLAAIPRHNYAPEVSLFQCLIYELSEYHAVVALGDMDVDPDDPMDRALFVSAWPEDTNDSGTVYIDLENGDVISTADVTWENVFIELAKRVRFVLLVPGATDGVIREIKALLRSGLASKTIVYMWPAHNMNSHRGICSEASNWNRLVRPMSDAGLNLPRHIEGGALFRLNADLSIRSTYTPIPDQDILSLVVADDGEEVFTPLRHVAPIIRNVELAAGGKRNMELWGCREDCDPI